MLVHEDGLFGLSRLLHRDPPSESPDELRDEEDERELDNQRNILCRIEDRLRGWGADEVFFVPVTSTPNSTLFDASNPTIGGHVVPVVTLRSASPFALVFSQHFVLSVLQVVHVRPIVLALPE